MTGTTAAIFWLVIAIILLVVESLTVQLLCVWFALGSLVAMFASFFGAGFMTQLVLFIITSLAVLPMGRSFLKSRLTPRKTATNADAVIGMTGLVIEEIDNAMQRGRVLANGLDWSARSVDDRVVPVRQKVLVRAIDGVKLIVEPIESIDQIM